jgi:hypothetical protein
MGASSSALPIRRYLVIVLAPVPATASGDLAFIICTQFRDDPMMRSVAPGFSRRLQPGVVADAP